MHIDRLYEGDRNTAFFVRDVKKRNAQNSVMRTINVDGSATTSLEGMKDRVVSHFTTLYSCVNVIKMTYQVHFPIKISPEVNAWLRSYPHEEEACFTIDSMPRQKALGRDGLTCEVLQHHWETCVADVMRVVLFFF